MHCTRSRLISWNARRAISARLRRLGVVRASAAICRLGAPDRAEGAPGARGSRRRSSSPCSVAWSGRSGTAAPRVAFGAVVAVGALLHAVALLDILERAWRHLARLCRLGVVRATQFVGSALPTGRRCPGARRSRRRSSSPCPVAVVARARQRRGRALGAVVAVGAIIARGRALDILNEPAGHPVARCHWTPRMYLAGSNR